MLNLQAMINECLPMGSMTIRNIDEQLKTRLRMRAAKHGRSMEDEARDILRAALSSEPAQGRTLVDAIRARVEPLGGVELEIAPREPMREPVTLAMARSRGASLATRNVKDIEHCGIEVINPWEE
jgi:plasmid stability protein